MTVATRPACSPSISMTGNNTFYATPGGPGFNNSTETGILTEVRGAQTVSLLSVNVTLNNGSGASNTTWTFRFNSSDSSLTVSVGTGGGTGIFEDTTNSASVSDGHTVAMRAVNTNGGGGGQQWRSHALTFTSTDDGGMHFGAGNKDAGSSGEKWISLGGHNSVYTTAEATTQLIALSNGTLDYIGARVTNATSGSGAYLRLKVNGSSSGVSASITSGATGYFEDTANSAAIVDNDLVGIAEHYGTSGTLRISAHAVRITATWGWMGGFTQTSSFNANSFYYPNYGATTSFDDTKVMASAAATVDHLQVILATNSRSLDQPTYLYVSGADSALTLTILAGNTGRFEDSSNSVALVSSDAVAIHTTNIAGTGSLVGANYAFRWPAPAAAADPFKPSVAMTAGVARRYAELRARRDSALPGGGLFNLLLSPPPPPAPPEGLRFVGSPTGGGKLEYAALVAASAPASFQSANTLLHTATPLNQAQSAVSPLPSLMRYQLRAAARAAHQPVNFSEEPQQFPIPVNQAQSSVSAVPALVARWNLRRLRTQVAREIVIATAFYVPNEMSSALISRPQPRRPWRPTTGTQLAPQVLIDTPPVPLPVGRVVMLEPRRRVYQPPQPLTPSRDLASWFQLQTFPTGKVVALQPRYPVRPTPAFRPPTFHELFNIPLPPGKQLWQPPAELFVPRRNTPQLEVWDLLNLLAFVPPTIPMARGFIGEPTRVKWSIRTRPELLEYLFPLLRPDAVFPPDPLDPELELLDCIVWDLETGAVSFENESGSMVWVIQDEECDD